MTKIDALKIKGKLQNKSILIFNPKSWRHGQPLFSWREWRNWFFYGREEEDGSGSMAQWPFKVVFRQQMVLVEWLY